MSIVNLSDRDKDRLVNVVHKVESEGPQQAAAPVVFGSGASSPNFGKVTAAAQISANRWTYTVQPMTWNGSSFVNSGTPLTGVKNLNEWNNTSGACGNGVIATYLGGHMIIQPASVGSPVVILYKVGTQWVFALVNGVDGTCL